MMDEHATNTFATNYYNIFMISVKIVHLVEQRLITYHQACVQNKHKKELRVIFIDHVF